MLLLFSACGKDSSPANPSSTVTTGIFVGTVPATNAFAAVVAAAQSAVAAVVDGASGIAEVFGGSRSSDNFALDSKGGASLIVFRVSPQN